MLVQTTASQEPIFQCRIEQAQTYIERTVSRGAKLIKKVLVDKKQHMDLIELNTSHSISELKYQNADLTTSIQILLGEYIEPTAASDDSSEVAAPPSKKSKKSRAKSGSSKAASEKIEGVVS